MREYMEIQFLYDVKYHDAVIALITSVNEKEYKFPIFVTEGSYGTYDPVERKLLFHLFEFIMGIPELEYQKPESLFDRFAQVTDGTGLAWYNSIKR